jgi:hypothetical protein
MENEQPLNILLLISVFMEFEFVEGTWPQPEVCFFPPLSDVYVALGTLASFEEAKNKVSVYQKGSIKSITKSLIHEYDHWSQFMLLTLEERKKVNKAYNEARERGEEPMLERMVSVYVPPTKWWQVWKDVNGDFSLLKLFGGSLVALSMYLSLTGLLMYGIGLGMAGLFFMVAGDG